LRQKLAVGIRVDERLQSQPRNGKLVFVQIPLGAVKKNLIWLVQVIARCIRRYFLSAATQQKAKQWQNQKLPH